MELLKISNSNKPVTNSEPSTPRTQRNLEREEPTVKGQTNIEINKGSTSHNHLQESPKTRNTTQSQ